MRARARGHEEQGRADFEDFVRATSTGLLRTAVLLCADRSEAEDLLQEAYAGLARHWERVRAQGSPEAYVRRALHNAAIDRHRRRSVRPQVIGEPTEDAAVAPGDPFADTDRRLTLRDALGRLTPRQRAVLVLRFYEQRTEVETAEALGCSVSTVKSQTRHALGRLRVLAPELASTFDREEAAP